MDLYSMRKINGNTLKFIACVLMLIDHFGASVLFFAITRSVTKSSLSQDDIENIYYLMRNIGRSAFPIFAFLIVEGFIHTHSRLRYSLSLLLFGLISEIPYDTLILKKDVFNYHLIKALIVNQSTILSRCNVYFTLLLGLLAIWGFEVINNYIKGLKLNNIVQFFLCIIPGFLLCIASYLIHSDYKFHGVILIMTFYVFRENLPLAIVFGMVNLLLLSHSEIYAIFGMLLILMYNQKQGRRLGSFKYLFYAFYPVHLIILFYIRCIVYG